MRNVLSIAAFSFMHPPSMRITTLLNLSQSLSNFNKMSAHITTWPIFGERINLTGSSNQRESSCNKEKQISRHLHGLQSFTCSFEMEDQAVPYLASSPQSSGRTHACGAVKLPIIGIEGTL
jgi:hypothetical protein